MANVVAARARYDEAVSAYRGRVRRRCARWRAALVTLDSSARRVQDTKIAAEGYEASLQAPPTRASGAAWAACSTWKTRAAARWSRNSTLIELQRERVAAWINLYRALGGGWSPEHRSAGRATKLRRAPRHHEDPLLA